MKVRQSPYRKILVAIVSMWALTIVLLNSCAPENQDQQPASVPKLTATASTDNIVNPETLIASLPNTSIGEILASPGDFPEIQVEIEGYYRGWDLLMEVSHSSPLTRSDWVIADESGAIYFTGILLPNLDPTSQKDTDKLIHLVATVEPNPNGIYLRAISTEVISTE